MTSKELKPCPMCGQTPTLKQSHDTPSEWAVTCKCGMRTYPGSQNAAVMIWNRRHPKPARKEIVRTDPAKCPNCGGKADNGFDRCVPPNPYLCSQCENAQPSEASCEGCWNVDNDAIICDYCSRGEKTDHFEKRPEGREGGAE